MPGRRLNWPTDEEMFAVAETVDSRAKVAKHFGIQPTTLIKRMERDHEFAREIESRLAATTPDGPAIEEIQEHQIRELERELRKRRKADVFTERVAMAVTDAIERRGVPEFPKPPKRTPTPGEHEFVLLWSDVHYGEVVSAEETNGINEYDTAICWERHQRMRESLLSYADNRPYKVERLHVLALGDMLSGSIHGELKETNEIPLAEAAVDFGERGAEWLVSLAERFRSIEFAGVVGNHPRFDQKPRAKTGFDNADWISYHHIRTLLRGHPAFSFDIPRANTHLHQVFDRNVLLAHGDAIRSSMPGVPWGGVMRRANALHAQYVQQGLPIDLYVFGHFHQRALVNGPGASRIALNGSPKGVDEYSLKAFGGGERPGQLLLTYHAERGLTDASYLDP